jgi:hypothetical protein
MEASSSANDRLELALALTKALSHACSESTAQIQGSLATGDADEFSDIDLLWSVPRSRFGEALGASSAAIASVSPLLSFRFDREDQPSTSRRLIFARLLGVPVWWRLDLEVRAAADGVIDDALAPGVEEWDPYESAAQNALATIKSIKRGRADLAEDLLRRGYGRIGRPRALTGVRDEVIDLAKAVAHERPHLSQFTDAVVAEARWHLNGTHPSS